MKTKSNILVIDDERVICESLTRILSPEGYNVDTKTHPGEGLNLVKEHNYDLLFLDLKMEEMDGLDVLKKIRMDNKELPVVIITGYPGTDSAIESLRLRATDYIVKPFSPEEILNLVSTIIPQKEIISKESIPRQDQLELPKWVPANKSVRFHEISWLKEGNDGTVHSGCQIPLYIAGTISEIKLLKVNDIVYRGLPLAMAVTKDKSRIMLPSSVSGKILDVNYELGNDLTVLESNLFDNSWIARIGPIDLADDLKSTQIRNVMLIRKNLSDINPYLPKLTDLGCKVVMEELNDVISGNSKIIEGGLIILDAVPLGKEGPEFVRKMNMEYPEAKIVVIIKPDSAYEEYYYQCKLFYYCIDSLFEEEITDILFSAFTSINIEEKLETNHSGILPDTMSRLRIINKHGKRVALLVFGELLHVNKGIGYALLNSLCRKSYPVDILRGTNHAIPSEKEGRLIIESVMQNNDLVITLHAEDKHKIPGYISRDVKAYLTTDGLKQRKVSLVIQPKIEEEIPSSRFNNATIKAASDLIYNEMTTYGQSEQAD